MALTPRTRLERDPRPLPADPILVVMAGIPLSGKSTLARALHVGAQAAGVVAENDSVRPAVAARLGRDEPMYDGLENHLTYRATTEVAADAVKAGFHVIHDATNLRESQRRPLYAAAEAASRHVLVVFVLTHAQVLADRYMRASEDRRRAYDTFARRRPGTEACTRPWLAVDGAYPVEDLVDAVAAHPLGRRLFNVDDAGLSG